MMGTSDGKQMRSKGKGRCDICGDWWEPGDEIVYWPDMKNDAGFATKWHAGHGSTNFYQATANWTGRDQIAPGGTRYTPQKAASGSSEGAPAESPPPPVASGEPAIYTYHRTIKVWWQGLQVGEVMAGVSSKGRPLQAVQIADVDGLIQTQVNLDEFGRRRK